MDGAFDPYYKWLGIRPQDRPITAYRLLGVTPEEDDREVIDQAADRQMAFLRIHQTGPHAELSQKLLNEVAKARLLLLDPVRRREYDRKLAAQRRAATPVPTPPPPSSIGSCVPPPPPSSVGAYAALPPLAVAVPVMPVPAYQPVRQASYPPPPSSVASSPYAGYVPAMPAGSWADAEDSQDIALSSLFRRAGQPGSGFNSVTSRELSSICHARRQNLGLWWTALFLSTAFLMIVAGATLVAIK